MKPMREPEMPGEASLPAAHPAASLYQLVPAVGCVTLSDCAADRSAATAEILAKPGATHLVVTHKSMTRALMGVALGLPPTGFRYLQVGNGSVSVWRINKQAKPILVTLNLTAHISSDDIFY